MSVYGARVGSESIWGSRFLSGIWHTPHSLKFLGVQESWCVGEMTMALGSGCPDLGSRMQKGRDNVSQAKWLGEAHCMISYFPTALRTIL